MKTAIIGAGISGLYLAWKLSEKGHVITVVEKEAEAGNKTCSGLLSERILDFFPETKNLTENKIDSVFLHFPRKTLRIFFSKRFLVIDHSKLDKIALNLAQNSGAKIEFNRNIKALPSGFEKIIGCDGADSFVRKSIGLPASDFYLGIQSFLDKPADESFVEAWPLKQGGFIWKIPRGEKSEYGIFSKPVTAGKEFNDFLRKKEIKIKEMKARLIPRDFNVPKNESITLCGDAAGLNKPWSGGGVIWGLTAANILVDAFPNFSDYRKKLKRFFLPKIFLAKKATSLAYFLGFEYPYLLPKNYKIESDFLL